MKTGTILESFGRIKLVNTCTPHFPFSVFVDSYSREFATIGTARRMYEKLKLEILKGKLHEVDAQRIIESR